MAAVTGLANIAGMNEDMLAVDKEIIKVPSRSPLLRGNGVDQCLAFQVITGTLTPTCPKWNVPYVQRSMIFLEENQGRSVFLSCLVARNKLDKNHLEVVHGWLKPQLPIESIV
jgi:hypothetical protein